MWLFVVVERAPISCQRYARICGIGNRILPPIINEVAANGADGAELETTKRDGNWWERA